MPHLLSIWIKIPLDCQLHHVPVEDVVARNKFKQDFIKELCNDPTKLQGYLQSCDCGINGVFEFDGPDPSGKLRNGGGTDSSNPSIGLKWDE